MAKKQETSNESKEEIVIDLTLSDDETETLETVDTEAAPETPFKPALNISGNILECRHYRILKSHSSWFTDDLINAFFCILQSKLSERCFAFSSFFYDSLVRKGTEYCLKHWTRGFKLFLKNSDGIEDRKVLFPVNSGGSHWVLVAWFMDSGTLNYYDSLMCRRTGNRIMKRISEFFNEMKTKESDEDIDHLFSSLSLDETTAALSQKFNFPLITNLCIPKGQVQQTDGSSCGPFCCLNGKSLFEDVKTTVDIYEFRASLIEYFVENSKNI